MFEHTMCTVVRRNGRDCFASVPEGAPIPLCVEHMREAYLFFAAHLEGLRELTDQQREDRSRIGIRVGTTEYEHVVHCVYYIRMGHFIKIGTTSRFHDRMSNLQPDEVLAIEPGDRTVESERHRQFGWSRAPKGREYFYPVAELMEHIEKLRADPWVPPEPPIEVPGRVRGIPCPRCDLLALWYDGTKVACASCGAPADLPDYPPTGARVIAGSGTC